MQNATRAIKERGLYVVLIYLIKRAIMTPFERAYCDLYNSEITVEQFAKVARIPDKKQAWAQLCEYRRRVIAGEIPDPRSKYNLWR